MNAFIRSVKSAAGSGGKEALIKKLITGQLSDSVKEIQLSNMGENLSGDSLQMGEAGTALCTVIEAMFLHGLKDSLVHRARRVMADIDVKPEPSFWSPLLIVSHKHIIDQVCTTT